ncbi:MAG: RNA 2',3'-cyclic phosphodiesterase [Planctomycetaceae bacterium]|nr:RNA 2',3'-cyclic phosphodiesterase [Planctomycetaceae bacterium]
MSMLRTFIALPVTSDAKVQRLLEVSHQLRNQADSVRLVSPMNFHITLKFLGDTKHADLPRIKDAVATGLQNCPGFDWLLRGVGVFPHLRRPRVVWAGVEPSEPFQRLAASLDSVLQPLGFQPEQRAYTPHLTLARINDSPPGSHHPVDLSQWLQRNQTVTFASLSAVEVQLIQSELTPRGPCYHTLQSFPLHTSI